MRLEVLIAYLTREYRAQVAWNFQLPVDSIERLEKLESAKQSVVENLPKCEKPSKLVWLLRDWELEMLILMAVQCPRWVRRQIWQYLTRWRWLQSPLNGKDLKTLGYKPGPQYRSMLDDLLAATLDGEVCDRASEYFLAKRFEVGARTMGGRR